jgi:hypothetical protein
MKRFATAISICMIAGAFIAISCNNQNETKPTVAAGKIPMDNMIKRGEYLVTIMGCDDCHSPKVFGPKGPELDMTRRLSGHPSDMPTGKVNPEELKSWMLFNPMLTAYVGPWGTTFSANLTSDESGIGNWSEQQFVKALREGKLKGMDNTRPIMPPMPWQNFGKASDDDLKAIFAFLKSTKPVHNVVPAPIAPGGPMASK